MNFRNYPKITEVVIPDGVKLQNDAVQLFYNMTKLISVNIHENVLNSITNMYGTFGITAFAFGTNLTGSPICGDKVANMSHAYMNCYKLNGSPVCGLNVTDMGDTYLNCPNLYGNMYMYSPSVSNVQRCFYGRNTSNMLNIYVTVNSTSQTTLMNYTNTYSLVGADCTWTDDTADNRYYNTASNIYIYPVENVAAARAANGD